jgi:3-hydroxyisobutyrate dehydrogenase-like beta-hydroxyacid dehydrogenase
MPVQTIAVLSPGDMGSAVGAALKANGFTVITSLKGRSGRTKTLAAEAGLEDAGTLEDVVNRADLILSILVPSQAESLARDVAEAISATGKPVAFADCNAVSPETAKRMVKVVDSAGGRFIDAGIIGGPPRGGALPRFYASGPHEAVLGELDGKGISVPLMGGEAGRASAIKMCYAAVSKGTQALYTASLIAAESLGTYDEFIAEMELSQSETLKRMQGVSVLSARAFRWIGEMEEIADTFAATGVTSKLHQGSAEMFQMIADSAIGHERPETVDRSRSLHDTIRLLAGSEQP